MVATLAWWEIGGVIVLGVWSSACVCYAFRVPRVHVFLNRHNRFGALASWALATTRNLQDNPGTHALEFRDVDQAGVASDWIRVLSSDYWVWHAFLWFPGKIAAFRLQNMGREIAFCAELRPPATRLIDEHGHRMECFVRELHPPAPHTVRQLRLLQHSIVSGQDVQKVVWQSKLTSHAAFD